MRIAIDIDSTLHHYWDELAGLRQAPLRCRPALRPAAHLEDQPSARRAAACRDRRHPLRRGHRPRRALSARRRDDHGLARRRPLHPRHEPSRRALPSGHRALAGRHRPGLRRPALLLRQGRPLRRARDRHPHRRQPRHARCARSRRGWSARPWCTRGTATSARRTRRSSAPPTGPGWPPRSRAAARRCNERPDARVQAACGKIDPDGRGSSNVARPRRRGRSGHRPAPLPAGRRARAPGRRLGPLGARRGRSWTAR